MARVANAADADGRGYEGHESHESLLLGGDERERPLLRSFLTTSELLKKPDELGARQGRR